MKKSIEDFAREVGLTAHEIEKLGKRITEYNTYINYQMQLHEKMKKKNYQNRQRKDGAG